MPAFSDDPEIATQCGAVDSNAFDQDKPFSAHLLRAMALTANRLISKGECLHVLAYDAYQPGEDTTGGLEGQAPPFWVQLTPPIPIIKKPGNSTAECQTLFWMSADHQMVVQVVTSRNPFNASAQSGDPGCFTIQGDGADGIVQDGATGIPISDGESDFAQYWMRGIRTGDALDTATYGSPATGRFEEAGFDWLEDTAASWNNTTSTSTNSLSDVGHWIMFTDSFGNENIEPRMITKVSTAHGFGGGKRIGIYPPFSSASSGRELLIARFARYTIEPAPAFRGLCISLYSEDRVL